MKIDITENVTRRKLKLLAIAGLCFYVAIFHVIDRIPLATTLMNANCLAKCENKTCQRVLHETRGSKYFTTSLVDSSIRDELRKNCWLTVWEFSHILTHIAIGYYFNIYVSLGISWSFELYEKVAYDCANGADLVWNFIGAVIGTALRNGKLT